jgi:hypothetical protein
MATTSNTTPTSDVNSEWNISTDIYDIARSINSLKARYINDKDETTLSLGIYGFLSDVLSKEVQTDTILTGILGNELFPSRAQLTKNVLAHAIYNSIVDINAIPSKITIDIGLKVADFNKYSVNNKFTFDHMSAIFIGDYEFHLDYDIILTKSATKDNVYSAHYDMTSNNRISTINQPYLNQPFVIRIGDFDYIMFQATVQQVTIIEVTDKIISESIIDNKSFTFSFPDQLVDFDVYITDNGVETRLTPLLNGCIDANIDGNYCWYLFISDNTIRITFDTKSFIPGLNSDIYVKAWTTIGKAGEFTYSKIDQFSEGLFTTIKSDKYGYGNLTCYIIADSDSKGGQDSKTKEELQKLIPKAAMSRGSITTETDVANYFNLIDNEDNRLVMRKKVDNNIARVWYCYMLLKDQLDNVIPTNCVNIKLKTETDPLIRCDDDRFILPAGAILRYDSDEKIAEIIDEVDVPELYSEDYYNGKYYYYMNVYNVILRPDPLSTSFYMSIINEPSYYVFNWVNETCQLQFVANRCTFVRNLLTDQSIYKFNFKIAQSISADFGLYTEEDVTVTNEFGIEETQTIVTNNMKCILVLYKEDAPYRWVECELTDYDTSNYIASWKLELETDNGLDDENNIKLLNLHLVGRQSAMSYGFFGDTVQAKLYILAKFVDGEFGRYDLDEIAPGFDEYTVTNIYDVNNGLKLFENYTGITNAKTVVLDENQSEFEIYTLPVVGLHYMTDEEHAKYFMDVLDSKKQYIEYCLDLLENNMDIDYKFYNTYGPSVLYTIGDKENTLIGDVALTMNFRISLINSSDVYTKDDVIAAIKASIEDLYVLGNWHAPNLIATLMNDYQFNTRCNYIEFMNYNNFRLGVQHIIEVDNGDPHTVPEFVNIRNIVDDDGSLIPDINVEIVDAY